MVTTLFALMLTGCTQCPGIVKPTAGAAISDPGAPPAEVEVRLTPPPEHSRAG
jgi:hypothetical protein